MIYRLIRDDGKELHVHGGIWESVLELAYIYGWKPAGTEEPQTEAWRRSRRHGSHNAWKPRAWDSGDYFSQESQHVGSQDASALARAVFRGLPDTPDHESTCDEVQETTGPLQSADSSAPTSPSVVEELNGRRRSVARGVAFFAERGGFTIDRTPEVSRR